MHDMEPLHSNMIACRLVFDGLCASIGATILWKSWDASNFGDRGNEVY